MTILTKVQTNGVDFSGSTNLNIDGGTLFVDATNNRVGVGTTSPSYLLHLAASEPVLNIASSATTGDGAQLRFVQNNGRVGRLYLTAEGGPGAGAMTLENPDGRDIIFKHTSNERLRIDSSGRVGIGTSSPSNILQVTSSATAAVPSAGASGHFFAVGSSAYGITGGALTNGNSYFQVTRWDGTATNYDLLLQPNGGRVGIGTTSAGTNLSIGASASGGYNGGVYLNRGASSYNFYEASDGTNTVIFGLDNTLSNAKIGSINSYPIGFYTGNVERARIDSSGRLLVGTSTYAGNGRLVAAGNTGGNAGTLDICSTASRPTAADTDIGYLRWYVAENSSSNAHYASIYASSDGASSSGSDIPGRLVFATTADGASSPTEQFRINNQGTVMFGTTDELPVDSNGIGITFYRRIGLGSFSRSSGFVQVINRKSDDGGLIDFRQDGTSEGSISVSGTTVSYNGAHLSRWSQLPSGQERTEILRGSVLSNIDEMCEWGEEDNEQLNRMKVSDIEGDKNVSGVFQAWDDDDDTYTNDFYCAMTGDFIIRIAEGVTVERGDLLMSAGDGTAKPQDDDIIRSKTIAKVTSTNVSCSYEDGSYCVPCVLMAC